MTLTGATGKKRKIPERGMALLKPRHMDDPNRPAKGAGHLRSRATVKRLKLYNQRAKRDKTGKIIHQDLQSKELPSTRIQPDRRWFGNTRVVGQKQLTQFREAMADRVNDPHVVIIRQKKFPWALVEDPEAKKSGKEAKRNLLQSMSFQDVYGPKSKRKRPKLNTFCLNEMVEKADEKAETFVEEMERKQAALGEYGEFKDAPKQAMFERGQSKRIWGELYKVVDSSDVLIQVLDARDPQGTRSRQLESYLKKHCKQKHMLLLLNKCDMVPAWVTRKWLGYLCKEYPTLAFHASITNPYGKGALLSILRQLSRLRSDKQSISVGFVGYPNVGKSSVINCLKTKKVCMVAPIPGETKVWQYITLMKKVFLIDCPGVVHNTTDDTEEDAVLKGVVRVEYLEDATIFIQNLMGRVKPEYIRRAYKIKEWESTDDFLEKLARRYGKLHKGGDPDTNSVAKIMLHDWTRGKLPSFILPPDVDEQPKPKKQNVKQITQPQNEQIEEQTQQEKPEEQKQEQEQQEEEEKEEEEEEQGTEFDHSAKQALEMQQSEPIPVRKGYFLQEDQGEGGVEIESDDDDAEKSEVSEDVVTEVEDIQQDEKSNMQQSINNRKNLFESGNIQNVDAVISDGEDSDGYGEEGLSWQAVLQDMQRKKR